MPTITVKNQDELTRVLANATSLHFVEMGPDAHGMVQDYDILAPTNAILKVAKGAKLTAHVPDLTVDVNGGVFDGNNKPHHVFINSGSATAGRGSKVTALGGTFRERGGATDAKTSAHIGNDAQAHISSGVVNVHNKARVTADGNAEVYAFDDAKVDAFGRAKVRADDNVVLRAHDHSEGHLHGKAQGYGSGPVVMTMVSPTSKAQIGSSAKLRVGEGVSHTQFSTSSDVEPEFISAAEASLPDTLNRIRGRGKNAYHRNAPAAPIMDEEVVKFLEGREPGDPLNIAVMKAYEEGYRSQADAAAAMVTAVDAAEDAPRGPSTAFMEGMELASKNMWGGLSEADQPTYQQVKDKYGKDFADGYAAKHEYLNGTPLKGAPDGRDANFGEHSYDGNTFIHTEPDQHPELKEFSVTSTAGVNKVQAEDEEAAREQHDELFPGATVVAVSTRDDADEEPCCAGCDCGNACAQGCAVGPVCSEYDENTVMCGKCSNPVEDCMCFSGPSFPLTEKVAVVPTYGESSDGPDPGTMELPAVEGVRPEGAVIAKPDEMLMKVGYKNGSPHTLQSFDWDKRRWGRSMIVAGGPGKALLTELERADPSLRKVPANVAAAYGHATGKCLMCSKPLSDTASLSRGYGRSCASKLG